MDVGWGKDCRLLVFDCAVAGDRAMLSSLTPTSRSVSVGFVLFLAFGLHATLISPASAQQDETAETATAFLKKLLEDEDGQPAEFAEALFAKAGDPKNLMKVEGGRHENSLERKGGGCREKMLEWLGSVLAGGEQLCGGLGRWSMVLPTVC